MKKVKYYATNQVDRMPPQGKFNAGQKQFYWIMFYGAIVLHRHAEEGQVPGTFRTGLSPEAGFGDFERVIEWHLVTDQFDQLESMLDMGSQEPFLGDRDRELYMPAGRQR